MTNDEHFTVGSGGRYTESDEAFRTRIANKYGMWGAFLSVVMESKGKALDDCGQHLGLTRIVVDVPHGPCSGTCSAPDKGDK
jgi:hypothetical protein